MDILRRRSIIVGFLFVLILGAACSANNNNKENNSSNEESGNEVSNRNDSDHSSGENQTESEISGELEIQYFVGGYGDGWWKKVISDFSDKYPNIDIIEHAGPTINKTMSTRWIANDPPDFVYLGGRDMSEAQMVADGQLMDLTEWMNDLQLEDGSSLIDSFIAQPSIYEDDKMYSVPFIFDTWGVWYNRGWFHEENLEVPKDFEGWMASMKEIQEKEDIYPFVTTGMHPNYFLNGVLYSALGSEGGQALLHDIIYGKEGAWSSDAAVRVMEKVQEIRDTGFIDPGFAGINHTQSQMNFLLGKNAYIPVGFFLPNEMKDNTPEGFEFGFIPPPMNDRGKPQVLVPNTGNFGIAKEAKNPEAALLFAEFVLSQDSMESLPELAGALPNIAGIDVAANPNTPIHLKDVNEIVNDTDNIEVYSLPQAMSNELLNPLGDALIAFMLEDIELEEFIERAETASENYRNSQ